MLATMALGAEGVQVGTLFALSRESSASEAFKQRCLAVTEGDTMLALKKIAPTRLVKNALYARIQEAEDAGASVDELRALLGKAASKRGIFEGDVEQGELEIGQVAMAVDTIKPASQIIAELLADFAASQSQVSLL